MPPVDRDPVAAGHDVCGGDHEVRRARPSRSPRSRARTPSSGPARRSCAATTTAAGASTRAGIGASGVASPLTSGNGSTRANARRIVRRRDGVVEALQDHRLLDLLVQVRQAGNRFGSCRAAAPATQTTTSPEQRAGDQAADRVEQADRRDEPQSPARERAGQRRDRLQQRARRRSPRRGRSGACRATTSRRAGRAARARAPIARRRRARRARAPSRQATPRGRRALRARRFRARSSRRDASLAGG